MGSEGSITHWVGRIKAGDEAAAQELWNRYFTRLVALCRKRLAGRPRRAFDEEDVALSAFNSLCQGAQKGRFPQLRDRDDLWRLLVVLAARKAIDSVEREARAKRGGGHVRGESAWAAAGAAAQRRGIEQVVGSEPTPEFALLVAEEYERLLSCLEEEPLRRIAQLKLEGYANLEIARLVDCSVRTVERKLWLTRIIWSDEGGDDE